MRIIASTHRDIEARAAEEKFRPDLFYRLSVFKIHLPPLRERGDDLPVLIEHYLRRFSQELGRNVNAIDPEALRRLASYSWPGNIRELQSILKQALLLARGNVLLPAFLPERLGSDGAPTAGGVASGVGEGRGESAIAAFLGGKLKPDSTDLYAEVHREVDRILLTQVLDFAQGSQRQAAKLLGIARQTLRQRLRELGLHVTHSVDVEEEE